MKINNQAKSHFDTSLGTFNSSLKESQFDHAQLAFEIANEMNRIMEQNSSVNGLIEQMNNKVTEQVALHNNYTVQEYVEHSESNTTLDIVSNHWCLCIISE